MDELKREILKVLGERQGRPIKVNELLTRLGLPASERKRLRRLVRELSIDGGVSRLHGQSFALPQPSNTIVGILRTSTKGFGFVVPEAEYISGGESSDIFIPRKRMGDAMNGDKVEVRIVGQTARSPEGQVTLVLERGTHTVVGTYYGTKRGGNVIPRDERFNRSISVPRPDPALRLDDGAFVLAEITEWGHSSQPLIGRVSEVLGDPETPGIDVTMIVRDAGVDPDFPRDVEEEAEGLPDAIPAEEIARRTDFRDLVTFTMDGATAKDFDDALSVQKLDGGMWRLGVHIADVSHYVREGSALDREAYDRATSIYPVDRVVPMLPEKLSNHVCSLRPREDRLTLSVLIDIDARGRARDYSVHEGVIRSAHRLVYDEVQDFLDGRAPVETLRELGPIRDQLDALSELRRALTAMRLRRGALDLDIPETQVVFHPDGTVKGIERRSRLETHRIVEECMLIANEAVATHLFNLHVPSVYRVHEPPDMRKLRHLQPILAHLGIRFPAKQDITPEALQVALDHTVKTETGFIARRLILRAMMQAHYDDENLGHYGLASPCYTHFTSPIRRYPDLLVHRLLRETMRAGAPTEGVYAPPGEPDPEQGMAGRRRISLLAPPPLSAERNEFLRNHLDEWTTHCSERERRAQDIENDSMKVKSLEYMRQHLGEEFWGYITSVLTWGFFVELEHLPVEGLVHVRNLHDDFYEYDEDRMILVGKQNGATFKLGDKVRVYVEAVNVLSMEMDFVLIEKLVPEGSRERQAELHRQRMERDQRHKSRQPRHGGFQRRGKRR